MMSERTLPPDFIPYRWQRECVDQVHETIAGGKETFMIGAGVGSGKICTSLITYIESEMDFLLVVVPKTGIRASWMLDARKLDMHLHCVQKAKDLSEIQKDEPLDGIVLTIQMIPSVARYLRKYLKTRVHQTLLVLDEVHHFGMNLDKPQPWTEFTHYFSAHVAFTIGLSGTPFRNDGHRIKTLDYKAISEHGMMIGVPSYDYSYAEALSDGLVAPAITRFMGGSVRMRYPDGRDILYDYRDGNYKQFVGEEDEKQMRQRLLHTACRNLDWQMESIAEARVELMQMREDGNPWAGFVICYRMQQATELAAAIEERWGDICSVVIGGVDTSDAVEQIRKDERITWVLSIGKISEGITIERLRVSVYLSLVASRVFIDQIRGRLSRLLPGVAQLKQTTVMFMPADPRFIDHALRSNHLIVDTVSWLKETSAEGYSKATGAKFETTEEELENLRDTYQKPAQIIHRAPVIVDVEHRLTGAVISETYFPEEQFIEMRRRLINAGVIDPRHVAIASDEVVITLNEIMDEEIAL